MGSYYVGSFYGDLLKAHRGEYMPRTGLSRLQPRGFAINAIEEYMYGPQEVCVSYMQLGHGISHKHGHNARLIFTNPAMDAVIREVPFPALPDPFQKWECVGVHFTHKHKIMMLTREPIRQGSKHGNYMLMEYRLLEDLAAFHPDTCVIGHIPTLAAAWSSRVGIL
jgi:hypothetical protein